MDKKKQIVREYILMFLGTAILSLDMHIIKIPNNFVPGGGSGIGVILGTLFEGINTSTIISILNLGFLILGWIFLGKKLGIKTIFCSLLYIGFLELWDFVIPVNGPMTSDRMLELIITVFVSSVGTALVLKNGGSTGGTEIVALIIKKFTKSDISVAMICTDIVIVFVAFFVIDVESGLYSLVCLFLKAFGTQVVVDAINNRKSITIITTHPVEIGDYITKKLVRGATEWNANGVFTDSNKKMIMTVVSKYQAAKISSYAKTVDPEAFIIINDCHQIYGKNFLDIHDEF